MEGHDPYEDWQYESDSDYLYSDIKKGVFYPITEKASIPDSYGRKCIGFFCSEDEGQYIEIYYDATRWGTDKWGANTDDWHAITEAIKMTIKHWADS